MPQIKLAESVKSQQSKKVQKEIQKLYKELAKEIQLEADKLPRAGITSDLARKQYLDDMVRSLGKEVDRMNTEIHRTVLTRMTNTADAVVKGNNDWFKSFGVEGLNLKGAFDYIPSEVVYNLVNGKVYSGDWNFSQMLWKSGSKVKSDMYTVVAKGIAAQKPTIDIAKDLEQYVNPTARKPWDWSKVYPGTNRKVDYSAQRLARTLIQHSYQLSFRNIIKYNPFVDGVKWHSVFAAGRTCDLCKDRDGKIYTKGKEPLDHPQGLCYLEPYINKDMDQIADELSDWVKGGKNKSLDKWYTSAMKTRKQYKIPTKPVPKKETAKAIKSKLKKPAYFRDINTQQRRRSFDHMFSDEVTANKAYKTIDSKVKDYIDNGFVGVRVDGDVLEKILNEGKLKNQFETGTSGGCLNEMLRKAVENDLMKVPRDISAADRPIYGMIYPKAEGAFEDYIISDVGDWYGDIVIRLKDEIKDVSSFTIGDSLDYKDDLVSAITVDNPEAKDIPFLMRRSWSRYTHEEFKEADFTEMFAARHDGYLEAQIHTEEAHKIDYFEEIIFTHDSPGRFDWLKEMLDEKGIKYKSIED